MQTDVLRRSSLVLATRSFLLACGAGTRDESLRTSAWDAKTRQKDGAFEDWRVLAKGGRCRHRLTAVLTTE